MTAPSLLLLCGIHSLAFALFHVGFWKLFKWPGSLRDTGLPNRAIVQIANVQLIWVFLVAAALCLLYPQDLVATAVGRAFLLGMSLFWVLRLAVQFVWLRIRHPLVQGLNLAFVLGAVLFALPLFL